MKTSTLYAGTKILESMNQAKFYNQWTLSKFDKYLKGNILEVGCGTGNFTATLAKYGQVTAIDIDPKLIQRVEYSINSEVVAGVGDIEKGKYFFTTKAFDTIVCLNVLEHIEDDQAALQNMYKLLKRKGRLILLIPIHALLYGEIDKAINHFRRYKPGDIRRKIERVGFMIDYSRKLNFLGALGWLIAGKILREKNIEERNIRVFNLFAPLFLQFEDLVEPPVGTSILLIAKKL